jgi:hypothetical protein
MQVVTGLQEFIKSKVCEISRFRFNQWFANSGGIGQYSHNNTKKSKKENRDIECQTQPKLSQRAEVTAAFASTEAQQYRSSTRIVYPQ